MKFLAIGLACALMSTIESLKVQQHQFALEHQLSLEHRPESYHPPQHQSGGVRHQSRVRQQGLAIRHQSGCGRPSDYDPTLRIPIDQQIYHLEDAWENQDPDFDCDKTDLYCWQDWLGSQYNDCDQNDFDCYQQITDQFTCGLEDPECWEQNIDQFYCSPDDDKCLSQLLPGNNPCQFVQGCKRN